MKVQMDYNRWRTVRNQIHKTSTVYTHGLNFYRHCLQSLAPRPGQHQVRFQRRHPGQRVQGGGTLSRQIQALMHRQRVLH